MYLDPFVHEAEAESMMKNGFGAMIVVELTSRVGAKLMTAVKPTLDSIIDQQL